MSSTDLRRLIYHTVNHAMSEEQVMRAIDAILKPTTIETIAALTAGTCELTDPDSSCTPPVSLTDPREIPFDEVCRLTEMILDGDSWFFAVKRCMPRPTAIIRMRGPKGNVQVSIDSCSGWEISAPAECKGAFFDPVRSEIVELLKMTFPEYASPDRRALWRQGAISALKAGRKLGEDAYRRGSA